MASLYDCRAEMRAIIRELRSIENGLRSDFSGVGEQQVADCVNRIADKCQGVLNRLNNVNQNRLAEWINPDPEGGRHG